MHIARHTESELVVVAGTRWISLVCMAAASLALYFAIIRSLKGALILTAFLVLFAIIMDLRKTFTFDAKQRVVRWSGRRVFKKESGEIHFDEITDIGTETQRAGRNIPIYRLSIVTPTITIPMAYAYSGDSERYASLRRAMLDFVKSKPASASRPLA